MAAIDYAVANRRTKIYDTLSAYHREHLAHNQIKDTHRRHLDTKGSYFSMKSGRFGPKDTR